MARWRIRSGDAVLSGTDTGSGPPILLLHGLASTHRWWDLVVPHLTRFRVVRFDLRGHGQSTTPPGGYTIARLAADARAVLDARDLDRVVVAGHSLGGAVALHLAATAPERVAALACVEGGLYQPRLLFGGTWAQARTAMVRPARGRITAAVLRAWLAGAGLPGAALPAVLANYTEEGPDGALRQRFAGAAAEELAHDLWTQDPTPLLRAVVRPVLALAARHGDSHQRMARTESIRRAHAELGRLLAVRWLTGGHELPLQQPEAVAHALIGLAAWCRAGVLS